MHLKAPSRAGEPERRRAAPSRSRLAELAARMPDHRVPAPTAGPRPIAAKAVGSFVPRLTKPAFERYGFSAAALITDWATIVGADLARYTMPERLRWPKRVDWAGDEVAPSERGRPGATLFLSVAAGRALDVQYKTGQIVERINAYFGYRAVADVRIVQVARLAAPSTRQPIGGRSEPPPSPPKPREELAAIAEPSLRAALERMAAGLVARKSARRCPA